MKTQYALTPLLAALLACSACGSLGDPTRKPALATVTGQLINPKAISTRGNVRIAVLWRSGSTGRFTSAVDLPVQPVFPSKFRIDLTDAPPADTLGDPFASNRGGTEERPSPSPSPPPLPASPGDGPTPVPGMGSGGAVQDAGTVLPPGPKPLLGTLGAPGAPSALRAAVGVVVAYEDLNGNGKLDLVDRDATAFVDRIVGSNENVVIAYFDGPIPNHKKLRDDAGHLPNNGYNLYRDGYSCETTPTLPESKGGGSSGSGPIGGSGGSGGSSGGGSKGSGPDAPPPPILVDGGLSPKGGSGPVTTGVTGVTGATSDDSCNSLWLPMTTLYELTLGDNSRFGRLMCTSGGFDEPLATVGYGGARRGRPATYPGATDPQLHCDSKGEYYVYGESKCTTVTQGPCSGSVTTCTPTESWLKPTPTPADWPCK
jgi:hypothetical protein